jgi:flagellar biosynthesis anti-sigma factor FlgM
LQSTSANSADQANLSSDAQQLSTLSGALANVPAIRQERVAPLSQAVQSGTYSASNQQIAQSLVRDFRASNSAAQS